LQASRFPRARRWIGGVAATLCVLALAAAAWIVWTLGPIGSGYAAKTVCSGVFVSGRDANEVFDTDVVADNNPLLALTAVEVDRGSQSVRARFLGLRPREARYVAGAGCTLGPAAQVYVDVGADRGPLAQATHSPVQALLERVLADPGPRTRALAVMQDGRILGEAYAAGFDARTPLPGWSMSKTVTAALAGIAVGRGALRRDSTGLLPYWSGDARAGIALEHLLRMTDGLRFDERAGAPLSDVVRMLLLAPDTSAFAAAKPLQSAPGSAWRYSSGTSNVLMRIVADAAGYPEREAVRFPRDALFDPLGIASAVLEPDPSGLPVGSSFLYASAHDWLRFGQFLLQDGVWDGRPILPPGWVRYMTTITAASGKRGFGAHVWLRVPQAYATAQSLRRPLPPGAFHAVGHEGQFLSIVPGLRLVVLRLGLTRPPYRWDHHGFLADVVEALPPR